MSKSRFVFDKFAKLIEQGLINYKDVSDEVISILKSKRDEIVFKMKLASKDEVDILNKRISNLEKKLEEKKKRKKTINANK
jgi:argininosuccinate lyase